MVQRVVGDATKGSNNVEGLKAALGLKLTHCDVWWFVDGPLAMLAAG
jgi:hypothetical protein